MKRNKKNNEIKQTLSLMERVCGVKVIKEDLVEANETSFVSDNEFRAFIQYMNDKVSDSFFWGQIENDVNNNDIDTGKSQDMEDDYGRSYEVDYDDGVGETYSSVEVVSDSGLIVNFVFDITVKVTPYRPQTWDSPEEGGEREISDVKLIQITDIYFERDGEFYDKEFTPEQEKYLFDMISKMVDYN